MTAAEQRERDARVCDDVAAKWRKQERSLRKKQALFYAEFALSRAEVAEECARQIRAGEVA